MRTLIIATLLFVTPVANAQNLLNKSMSLDITRQRLDNVLEIISNKGSFFFSYNSNILNRDTIVSFNANNQPVKNINGYTRSRI